MLNFGFLDFPKCDF